MVSEEKELVQLAVTVVSREALADGKMLLVLTHAYPHGLRPAVLSLVTDRDDGDFYTGLASAKVGARLVLTLSEI